MLFTWGRYRKQHRHRHSIHRLDVTLWELQVSLLLQSWQEVYPLMLLKKEK
jgi:hypothetical protein